jgi:predicted porin
MVGGLAVCSSFARAADVQINGFGSAYMGYSISSDAIASPYANNSTINFTDFTRFGLNVSSRLSEDWDAGAQFEMYGNRLENFFGGPSYNLTANWAFINYHPGDLFVKLGRQLYPSWLAAEYLEVGFLQPYRALPQAVISLLPYRGFDGLTIGYKFDLGFARFALSTFGGRANYSSYSQSNGTASQAVFDTTNLLGVSGTLTGDGYRVHASFSREKVTGNMYAAVKIPPSPLISIMPVLSGQEANATTLAVGANYDKNNIVVWTEYAAVSSADGTTNSSGTFLKGGWAGYALVGYRIGSFMPRYMYSTADYGQLGISSLGKVVTHDIGVNYQVNDKVILKADFQLDTIPDGSTPTFVTRNVASATSATSATLGLDFVF